MNLDLLAIVVAKLPLFRGAAYLDPGSGSFLIQLLIGALVGAGFVIKAYWRKIKAFFNRSNPDTEHTDDTDSE